MLRVGLTGELGSGKSTVLLMLAELGAVTMSSDDLGRELMQPGQPVYHAIVERFGSSVLLPDGKLNRPELARLAFDPTHPRVEELNAIVHPAVIAEQQRRIDRIADPNAIVVVESALIFTTRFAEEPWQNRFDRIVVVTAPDEVKIERFMQRSGSTREDAERRLATQRMPIPVGAHTIANTGDHAELQAKVTELWRFLVAN